MRISLGALVGWVGSVCGLVGVVGAYPTWRIAGRSGIEAEVWAGAAVLVVTAVNAVFVFRGARKGPGGAALAFVIGGLVRIVVCVFPAGLVGPTFHFPRGALLTWMVLFCLGALGGETLWLTRALLRHGAGTRKMKISTTVDAPAK